MGFKKGNKVWKLRQPYKHTEERKQKIGAIHKGKKLSEETKKKISESNSGINNGWYNKKRPEHSKRMSGKNNPNYKENIILVCKTCIENFEVKPCHRNRIYCSKKCANQKPWNKNKKGVQIAWNKNKILSPLSEEHKIKIGDSQRGKKLSEETKQNQRIARIKYIKKYCKDIRPNIGRNEKQILDKLEKEIGYKIIRQSEINGYFVDGYVTELNLVIEVDEKHHKRQKIKDKQREENIKKELNCEFLRIKDY